MATMGRHLSVQPRLRALVAASCVSSLVLVLGPAAPASAASASFAPPDQYEGGYLPLSVSAGDFNADGDPDLVVVNGSGTQVSVSLGGPGGTFGDPTDYPVADYPQSATVGDFNDDGDPDLVVTNTDSNNVSVLLGGPGGTFGAATNVAVGLAPNSAAVGDFNGDGDPDLAVANEHSDSVSILLGGPGGSFEAATNYPLDNRPSWVVVGDFNADSDPDLAVASELGGTVSVLLGGPGGSFGAETDFAAGTGPSSVAVGDFNADSDPDLAFGTDEAGVTVLLGGPAGTFGSPTAYAAAGMDSPQVAVGDFNADSDPDIVLTGSASGVSVYLGGAGGSFGAATTFDTGGDTLAIAVGDFDADSLPDLAAANYTSSYPAPTPEDGSVAVLLNTLDLAPPETSISSGPDGPTKDSTPTFGFTSSEAGSTFECRVDEESFAACTSPRTTASLGDGSHTFEVRATDPSGNLDPTPASRTFTVDTVAPDTLIIDGPTGVTGDATPTFQFASNPDGATWECRVDDAEFASCPTPYTTAELADGEHTMYVRATDLAGNVDPTPASRTFMVDTVGPETVITGGPDGPTNDTTPTFTFTSPDPEATFECGVDAGWSTCTSPFTSGNLGGSDHTFLVRARDALGNRDATPATRSFTIDRIAPSTSITFGPNGVIGDNTPTFGFTSPDDAGATFECRFDAEPFEVCTSPYTTAALSDGAHVFNVRAIDSVGNVDPDPAGANIHVDTTAPETTITSGPTGLTTDNTPIFSFDATVGVASFECRFDDAPFAACVSPVENVVLADGEHTFELRAIDTAGNVDPTPDSRTFTVDTVVPDTTITGGPSGLTSDATPTFTFTSTEPGGTFECFVSSAGFEPCTSPYTYAPQPEGSNSFIVHAIDPAGNVDETAATRSFYVDTNAPDTEITSGPSGPTADATPTFGFSSDPGVTFECRLDNAAFAACTSPHTTAALADGSHTFEVRAADYAGNTDPTPDSRTFVLDSTAPDTTITSGPSGPTGDDTPTFGFSSPDAGATFECRVDSAAFAACTSPFTTAALADGSHTFDVRATDALGNTDPTPAGRTFTVSFDTAAPQTTITSGPSGLSLSSKATFGFTSSGAGSSFQCRLDGAGWQACTSPRTYTGLRLGNHTFEVRAIDPAGNVDPTPAQRSWLALGLLNF